MRAFRTNWLSLLCLVLPLNSNGGTVRALDYSTPAYIDFELSSVTVEQGQKSVVINIYRTGDFRQTTAVDFATEEITATEGRDYKGTGGTITFRPGEGYKSITIDLLGLDPMETNKTFQVKLSADSANTLLMRDTLPVTIEPTARVASAAPALRIAPGANGTVVISWDGGEEFVLERSANAAKGNWERVESAPSITEGHCEVCEETGGGFYAYRLRGQ